MSAAATPRLKASMKATPRIKMTANLLVASAMTSLALVLTTAGATPLSAQEGVNAEALYNQWCAGCHGVDGTGTGAAAEWMLPRPRDFTNALYQIRSTASGQIPTDEDILTIINQGMPGTTMPGWESLLSEEERLALVEYLKSFSPFFENSPPPEPLDFGEAPAASEERIAEGAEVYRRIECYRCHGDFGRGDGESAPTLETASEILVRARDLTEGWTFNGGNSVEAIYRRMRTGMDGTPMPSQSDLIAADVITDDELWSLAHYVRSLSPEGVEPGEAPEIREVVVAELLEEEPLPTGVDDERWETVDRFYIPLVGQIIIEPRWFDPRVNAVWVQALHDGEELVMRLTWNDPSESPDADWAEWRTRMLELVEPTASRDIAPEAWPDRIAVQFPVTIPEGNERPYFLMGDGRSPVYLWSWASDGSGPDEMEARGMPNQATLPAETQNLSGEAVWDNGQWRVLLRRPLAAAEDVAEMNFVMGQMIPIAFFAWDGDNAEEGTRGGISSWFFLHLGEPASSNVYVAPLAAVALTALLGIGIVRRAQRKEREPSSDGAPEEVEGTRSGG